MMSTALALTTADLLFLHSGPALERIAVVDGERQTSFGELQRQVDALAASLASVGVIRGGKA